MAIYTPGRASFFGQLPVTPPDQLLSYKQFVTLVVQDSEPEAQEQVLQAIKHAVMSVSALVCDPHALDDFRFQLLPLRPEECMRDVRMTPKHSKGNQRSVKLHLQLSTAGELLYVSDVTVRAYFPKMV